MDVAWTEILIRLLGLYFDFVGWLVSWVWDYPFYFLVVVVVLWTVRRFREKARDRKFWSDPSNWD